MSRFEVRAGEVLAIAGVQGNGQTELAEAITGLRHHDSITGSIKLDGREITRDNALATGTQGRRLQHPGGPPS